MDNFQQAIDNAYAYYSEICDRVNGKTFVEWILDEWQIEIVPSYRRYIGSPEPYRRFEAVRYNDNELATMFRLRFE